IIVEYVRGNGVFPKWRQWKKKVQQDLPKSIQQKILSIEGMIQSPAIYRRGNDIDYIILRGQEFEKDPKTKENLIPKDFPRITEPVGLTKLPLGRWCLLGREMTYLKNLKIGDSFEIVVPRHGFRLKAGAEANITRCNVAGFFKTGHYQYDSRGIVMPLEVAQRSYGFRDNVQQLVLRLKSIADLRQVKRALYKIFPPSYYIRTVEDEQRNFFAALQLEKTVMTIIVFMLIVSSLAFIVVAMFNTIRSRQRDIGVLKSLGVSSQGILTLFTFNGFLMGAIGTILGIMLGLYLSFELENILHGLASIINTFGHFYVETLPEFVNSVFGKMVMMPDFWVDISLIPKDVYYFDTLPVAVDTPSIYLLSFLTILLTGIASLIPARFAAKLEIMDIIRGAES
ncbi:MAG: ABC transporter permease, partial [Candidatus Hydrogenedentota bacterium]